MFRLPPVKREVTTSFGAKLVLIPPGTFWMGGGGGQPGDRQVEIAEPFYIGIHPVTQRQWETVMKSNPSCFTSGKGGGPDHPVEMVSWDDVQQFLKELNAKKSTDGLVHRLPTEAEWEYVCREASSSKEESAYHFYLDHPCDSLSSTQANFNGAPPDGAVAGPYLQRTSKVGSYPPNKLGIYDMQGNVWEWTADAVGSDRGIRGGGWRSLGSRSRAAYRNTRAPSNRRLSLGFRLAAVPSSNK